MFSLGRGAHFHIIGFFVFEPIWASKNLQNWSQNRPQIVQKCIQKFGQQNDNKNDGFGIDLGSILAPKLALFLQILEGQCVAHQMFYRVGRCSGFFLVEGKLQHKKPEQRPTR